MKRFHVHVAVDDLEANIRFYSSVFGAEPTVHARSDKYWITDPQGIAWETYRTLGEANILGADTAKNANDAGACCAPRRQAVSIVSSRSAKCC